MLAIVHGSFGLADSMWQTAFGITTLAVLSLLTRLARRWPALLIVLAVLAFFSSAWLSLTVPATVRAARLLVAR